jgi:GNAT superfamily N-acetyltransferase
MTQDDIRIERLAAHRRFLPLLRTWLELEWPSHYGAGGAGNAEADLRAYAGTTSLPIGVVALSGGEIRGLAALKAHSMPSRPDLGPWAGAGIVPAPYRRRGIGAKLLAAVEDAARGLGFTRIHCATGTSSTLLERNAWRLRERIDHEGESLAIYEKAL